MISPSLTSSSTEGGSNVKIDQVTILVDYTGGAVRRQGIFTSAAELRTV
jgi:alcohol dehydrogenase YqhD (iron-dependent ADH family)